MPITHDDDRKSASSDDLHSDLRISDLRISDLRVLDLRVSDLRIWELRVCDCSVAVTLALLHGDGVVLALVFTHRGLRALWPSQGWEKDR